MDFHEKLNLEHNVKKEFARWDLKLDSNLLDIKARVLPSENITFGNRATLTSTFGDWSKDMRRKRCFVNKKLYEWVLVTSSEERCVQVLNVPCRLSSRYVLCVCIHNAIHPLCHLD